MDGWVGDPYLSVIDSGDWKCDAVDFTINFNIKCICEWTNQDLWYSF